MRVYISYAHTDREIARRLTEELRNNGIEVSHDEDSIRPGSKWQRELLGAIRSADAVLVLVTNASLSSSQFLLEIESLSYGAREDLLLMPIFVDETTPDLRIPYDLVSRQGVRLDSSSPASFAGTAHLITKALDRRLPLASALLADDRVEGRLSNEEIRDTARLVIEAFAVAGRSLRMTEEPELLAPEPVWVSAEVSPGAAEVERFSRWLRTGHLGYFVYLGELRRDAEIVLDQMRVGGKTVITLPVRALRAAHADGRIEVFLTELERDYGTKDNLFDTKNALIDERFLFGRDVMLNTIGSSINRDEHVLVTGLRKVGKTSLLNVLRQRLVDQPVCMVDLQRFDRHYEEWPSPLFQLIVAAFDRWGKAERPQWPFTPASPETTTELERELRQRFDHLGPAGAGKRVVVILDEIERVFPGPGEPEAARRWIRASGALRALSQGERRYVVVVGADLRPVANRSNDLGPAGTNPFFSLFQERPMPLLDERALGDMVESLARAMGVDVVTTGFIAGLSAMTGGHPSLARSIAGEAYRQRQQRHRLTDDDLVSGLSQLDDDGGISFFLRNNLWQLMTQAEREVMVHLAHDRVPSPSGPAGIGRIALDEAHSTLRAQGLVDGGKVRIGLFGQWIRDHAGDG
ncbi:MAG TPA: toll/interleukin-1 receptor domain-containing protein [Streptosporangiaceae bacterium]|jgi:hypothetical protein